MRKFMVRVTDQSIRVYDEQGEVVEGKRVRWLIDQLDTHYPRQAYIYIAEHTSQSGLYKIGVSERPQRRETEIDGLMVKQFKCTRKSAYRVESDVHEIFTEIGCWVEGEWFRLIDEDRNYLSNFDLIKDWAEFEAWATMCYVGWWHESQELVEDYLRGVASYTRVKYVDKHMVNRDDVESALAWLHTMRGSLDKDERRLQELK